MKMRLQTSRRPLPLAACICCLLFAACSRESEPKWEKDLSEGNYIALPAGERTREGALPQDVSDFNLPPAPQTLQKAEEATPVEEEPPASEPPLEKTAPSPSLEKIQKSEPPPPPAQSLQKVAPPADASTKGSAPPKFEPLKKSPKDANERPSLKRPIPVEGKTDG